VRRVHADFDTVIMQIRTFGDRVRDLHCRLVVERTGCKREEELKAERNEEIDGIVGSVAVYRDGKPEGQQCGQYQEEQHQELESPLDSKIDDSR
jgi:hypothetical protein